MPTTDKAKAEWLFWGPVLGALVVGVLGIIFSHRLRGVDTRAIVFEFSVAFLIAAFIGLTIEQASRYHQRSEENDRLERIKQNVFEELFNTALPKDLVKEMYLILFPEKFLRHELTIKFKFEPLSNQIAQQYHLQDILVLTQTVSYKAENIYDLHADHRSGPRECAPFIAGHFKQPFTQYRVSCPECQAPIEFTKSTQPSIDTLVSNQGMWYELDSERLTLRKVPPKAMVTVTSEVQVLCRYTDTRTWLTYHPAKKLSIEVELDPTLVGKIEFTVDKSHRCDMAPDKNNPNAWSIDKPILPHQGVMLFWRPTSPSSTSTPGSATTPDTTATPIPTATAIQAAGPSAAGHEK